jgi:drug/metabolite transporter (DMT)-like permease
MAGKHHLAGIILVAASAILWSFGGPIARFITVEGWTVVFWRSYFAVIFLLCFLVLREGPKATLRQFTGMGWPGLAVACCFAGASTCFVIALSYTTVANILLMQAGVPLIAALMCFLLFKEQVSLPTWFAIAAVIAGVFVMVSETLTGKVSPIGDGLSLLIALLFATATVLTRRHHKVRMTPAVTLGILIAMTAAVIMGGARSVTASDLLWLIAFGALNLGAGLAAFALGARLIPAAIAALIGTLEPVLGPIWVWLVHGEVPSVRTIIGGSIVFAALLTHLLVDFTRKTAAARLARSA